MYAYTKGYQTVKGMLNALPIGAYNESLQWNGKYGSGVRKAYN